MSNNSHEVDIAIIGGGNAGLTLAAQLAAQKCPPNTVVIEPQPPTQRDCSWGLWAQEKQAKELSHSTKGRWKRWQLIDHLSRVTHSSDQYSYVSLSSADYLLDRAAQLHQPVSLVEESVSALKPGQDRTTVVTDQNQYSAKTVYDSRPPKIADNGLRQHFLGWHIHTEQPIKDPDTAILMDFRVDQSRGLHFIYALPFSEHHILVESTLISTTVEPQEWYRNAIKGWLKNNNIQVAEIISEEIGVIPMDTLVVNKQRSQSTVDLSATASDRPNWCRQRRGATLIGLRLSAYPAADQSTGRGIEQGNRSVPTPISSRLTTMDKIFNGVLISRPELAVSLYMRMAKALTGDQFSRFMLGEATTSDWLRVIAAMPKGAFLKQLVKQLIR